MSEWVELPGSRRWAEMEEAVAAAVSLACVGWAADSKHFGCGCRGTCETQVCRWRKDRERQ